MTDETCWTVIRDAARGDDAARARFARDYDAPVRAYLLARWARSPLVREAADAAQDVFVECFKEGGVLDRGQADRPGGFRAFLFGVTRNVARRWEARPSRRGGGPVDQDATLSGLPAPEEEAHRAFDRTWAAAIMREAAARQRALADAAGAAARRRVDLLRLRFQEGLTIRAIAERWDVESAGLHHEYARARREFRAALQAVVAHHHPGTRAQVDAECASLLQTLEAHRR